MEPPDTDGLAAVHNEENEFQAILRRTGGKDWGNADVWQKAQQAGRDLAMRDARRRRN